MERWELIPEEFEDGSRSGRKLITRAGKAYGHIARSCRDAREEDLMLATAAPELFEALENIAAELTGIAETGNSITDNAPHWTMEQIQNAGQVLRLEAERVQSIARAAIARAKGVDRG